MSAARARARLWAREGGAGRWQGADRDPRWRHRRHDHREPACAAASSSARRRSTSSTETTGTSTSPGCCSSRSASLTPDEIVRAAPAAAARRHRLPRDRGRRGRRRDRDEVLLGDGTSSRYDVLVIASGARLQPEETEGSPAPAGTSASSRSTTRPEPRRSHAALARFDGGRLVVERRRHADQVPRRAARVRFPRRLVPARAQDPRRGPSSSTRRRSTAAFTKRVASEQLG